MYLIKEERLKELLEAEYMYDALKSEGVENWMGYEEALEAQIGFFGTLREYIEEQLAFLKNVK